MSGGYSSVNGIKKTESVQRVVSKYKSEALMSALCVVRIYDGDAAPSIMNGSYDDAKAIGIAISSGKSIDVLMFGTIEDNFFSRFQVNDFLYLGPDSMPTNVVPSSGYFVRIGKYLGNNIALIQVEPPILL